MFDEINRRLNQKSRFGLQRKMTESLPLIYNTMYPSTLSIATNTQNQLVIMKESAKRSIQVNSFETDSELVQQIIEKIQSINNRASKLIQEKKPSTT